MGVSAQGSFDVVVLGGGPAGAATAIRLAERGVTVAVFERSLYGEDRVGETFPPDIRAALTRLGLWRCFETVPRVPSVGVRSVWGGAEPSDQSFVFKPFGVGWHVDRRAFDASLALAARARGVRVGKGHTMLACERDAGGGWKMRLTAAGETFDVRSRFVVDATGRASSLIRRLGGARVSLDTLVGVVGYFKATREEVGVEDFTLVEAAEDGWWYSAPLPRNRLIVAFMTDADLCARGSLRDAGHWLEKLRGASHTSARARPFSLERTRIVSANSSRADPVCGDDWLAVGDAAAACDPLSGDGVYRALTAGVRAADTLVRGLAGDTSALRQYGEELRYQFASYIQTRNAYYGLETRWSRAPFWQRRLTTPPHVAPSRDEEPAPDGAAFYVPRHQTRP